MQIHHAVMRLDGANQYSSIVVRNGDQVFVVLRKDDTAPETPTSNAISPLHVKQDPLDDELVKQKGTIKRKRSQL